MRLKTLRRSLRGTDFIYSDPFAAHSRAYLRSLHWVRLFYGLSAFLMIRAATWAWEALNHSLLRDPVWVVEWLSFVPLSWLVSGMFGAWALGSVLAFWRPDVLYFRLLTAVGVFLFAALDSSDGEYVHQWYPFFWAAMILVFLPAREGTKISRARQHTQLLLVWACQFVVSVFYFLTALCKIKNLGSCALDSGLNCESPMYFMANMAAFEWIKYQQFAPFLDLLLVIPALGLLLYALVIYLELFALHFAFRLDTHLLTGILRLAFHAGAFVFVSVDYMPFVLMVVWLFVLSPFHDDEVALWTRLCRLPGLRWLHCSTQ